MAETLQQVQANPEAGNGQRRGGRRRPRKDASPNGAAKQNSPQGGARGRRAQTNGSDGRPELSMPEEFSGLRVIRISSKTFTGRAGTALTEVMRQEQNDVAVGAVGGVAINTALKAIIAARRELQEQGCDLNVRVRLMRGGHRDAIAFRCSLVNNVLSEKSEADPIRLAKVSVPGKVAGAVAGRVRKGEQPALCAVGVQAVRTMVRTAAIATKYLEEEGNIDITIRPYFVETELKVGMGSAARIDFFSA